MIKRFISFLFGGFFLILALVLGGVVLSVYLQKDKFIYKEPLVSDSSNSQVLGESTVDLDQRIDNLERNLDSSGSATLILSEEEAEDFISSFLTNLNIGWLPVDFEEFYIDFALNTGYLHTKGPFELDLSAHFYSYQSSAGNYYPKVESVYCGPVKIPQVFTDKLNDLIYQSVEQMKTENFGSRKISNLRLLQDKLILEFERI